VWAAEICPPAVMTDYSAGVPLIPHSRANTSTGLLSDTFMILHAIFVQKNSACMPANVCVCVCFRLLLQVTLLHQYVATHNFLYE